MFLGHPDLSLFFKNPDPSINKEKSKYLDFYYFVTFYYFLSMTTDLNVLYFQKVISKKNLFFVGILSSTDEKAGSGSVSQWYGSADPDAYQNVTDPQH
jgi:hypothetical protein